MTEKKRKPKATGPRTEVFAMRLDPKLKYLAEIEAAPLIGELHRMGFGRSTQKREASRNR